MKNFIIVLILALLLFSCSSDKKENKEQNQTKTEENQSSVENTTNDASAETTSINENQSSSENEKGMLNLEYKFHRNEELNYLVTQESETQIKATSKDSVQEVSRKRVLTNNVKIRLEDINKDGSYDLGVTVEDFNLDFNVNGEKKNYSSKNLPEKRKEQRKIDYHVALLNNEFSVSMTNKGKILLIARTEDIVTEMLKINSKGASIEAIDKTPYSERLIDNVLLPFTKNIFRKLPLRPVTPDSVWHDRFTQRIGKYILDNSYDYSIADIDDNLIKIKIGISSKIFKEIKEFGDSNQVFTMEPKFSGGGTLYFDTEKGVITKIHLSSTHEYEFKDVGAEEKPIVHYFIKDIYDAKLK